MPDPIVIREYDPASAARFEAERERLWVALQPPKIQPCQGAP